MDLGTLGSKMYGPLEVEIIDSVADYVELMQEIFDFGLMKKFFKEHPEFTVLMDSLSGGESAIPVTGLLPASHIHPPY